MALKQYECPNCGSRLHVDADGKLGICPACDGRFLIEDDVIRHRVEGTVTVEGLTTRAQLHKRAGQFMQQGQYAEAASLYHEIIDKHDAHDSDAWWGLARVSVKDFSDPGQRVTRGQLGQNYLRATEYATPEKREAYEAAINAHDALYRSIIAEREAKRAVEQERVQAEEARRREEQRAAEESARKRREEREARERAQREKQAAERRARSRKMRRFLLILLVAALCIGAYAWFVAIPNSRYEAAMALMGQGDYARAQASFAALGGYRDSAQRVRECAALEALAAGDVEGVLDMLDSLQQDGDADAVRRIQDVAIPAVGSWQENGFSPRAVLAFLEAGARLDPDGALDADALSTEAHVALAGGEALLAWRVQDVDGDGTEELLALDADGTLRAYRMAPLENQEIALPVEAQAQAFADMGAEAEAVDTGLALACYVRALGLKDSPENRQRVADAYTRQAVRRAEAGEMSLALEDAEAAVEALDTEGNFSLLYDIAARAALGDTDMGAGIALWEDFRTHYGAHLEKYGLLADADAQSGALCLNYANALSAERDIACAGWYAAAYNYGVPVLEAMDAAALRFEVGIGRLRLRFDALAIAEAAGENLAGRRETLTTEVDAALTQWEAALPGFQQVFGLLKAAREAGLAPDAEAAGTAYRGAALAGLGAQQPILASAFYDWDGDGWEEAVVLTGGQAALCIPEGEGWRWASTAAVPAMDAPQLEALKAPVVLARDAQGQAFAALTVENGALQVAYAAQGVENFTLSEDAITFSSALEGSIVRYADMRYDLNAPHDAPALLGVDWQQDAYPQPGGPDAAVLRLLETLYYGIPGETAVLSGGAVPEALAATYTAEALAGTPAPGALPGLRCAVCLWGADGSYAIVEACYGAGDGAVVRYFAAVPAPQGGWQLAGASPTCGALGADTGDTSLAPLPLNGAAEGSLAAREGRTWRVLLPFPAEVAFAWEAAEAEGTFSAVLARGDENVIAYRLEGGVSQRTNVFYLSPGVYTLTLTSSRAPLGHFSLTCTATPKADIELEPNDAIATATPIGTGTEVAASLQTEEDIDLYRFTLAAPGRVRVLLDGAADAYTLSLAPAADARALYTAAGGEAEEVYLAAGDYIVQVAPGAAWTAGPYVLCIGYTVDTAVEQERNDTPGTATPIAVGSTVTGRFNSTADADYYAFALEEARQVRISLGFTAQDGSREGLALTLYAGDVPLYSATAQEAAEGLALPGIALPAGEYAICVANQRMAAGDYTLHLQDTTPEGTALEAEPNDAPGTATPVPLDVPISGALLPRAGGGDVDTYAFTLDKPGAATLSFAFAPPQGITGSFYVLTLADASHSAIWSGAIDAAESVSPTLYLGAGTYYVQVTVGRNAWPGAYTLSMGFEARADGEAEGNGSMEAAAPIPANTPIHGSFLHSGDVDWFRLVLDAPAVVQLRLQFAPLEENARTYVLTLTDGGQEYLRANVRGQESDFAAVPVCLDAGTYYIQLENPGFIAQEYALTAVCVAAQAVEQEPNDTLAGATPLLAGRAYSGVCASRQDVDTYLLTVAPEAAPALRFAFEPFGGEEAAYTLHLAQNGKTLWGTDVAAASGGVTATIQLPAGEYYLTVTPADWTAAIYTIALT